MTQSSCVDLSAQDNHRKRTVLRKIKRVEIIFFVVRLQAQKWNGATTKQDVAQPYYPDSDVETDDLWNITKLNYGSTFFFP